MFILNRKALGTAIMKYADSVFCSFHAITEQRAPPMNISQGQLLQAVDLFARLLSCTDVAWQDYEVCLVLTSQSKFIDTLYLLSRQMSDKFDIVVWAASILMQFKRTPCITHSDILKLAEIGFQGLIVSQEQSRDSIKSDSCWLFDYLFEDAAGEDFADIISQTATPATIASLVSALDDEDLNIIVPATKATANLLSLDDEQIVDRLLFHRLIDKYVRFI